LSKPEIEVLPYPLQRALVKNVTAAAEKVDRPELMQLWAGQSAAVAMPTDVEGFLKGLVEEVEKNLGERVSR
jgi:nitronate monooxygenase